MEVIVAKSDLSSACRQVLLGRNADSIELADFATGEASLKIVITGRSVEIAAEVVSIGAASVPIETIAGLKRIISTYADSQVSLRVTDGKLRFQRTNITNPAIVTRGIAARIIDIPADARTADLLSLLLLFTPDEINDSNLTGKVVDAQAKFTRDMDSVQSTLREYGVPRQEVRSLVDAALKRHAEKLKCNLFPAEG